MAGASAALAVSAAWVLYASRDQYRSEIETTRPPDSHREAKPSEPVPAEVLEQPLSGRVWDESEHPIAGAQVVLTHSEQVMETRTNALGTFTFRIQAQAEARVKIEVHSEGYQPRGDWANLGNTRLDVVLKRRQ